MGWVVKAYLVVLEDLGAQLREDVRRRRREREPAPLPVRDKRPAAEPPEIEITARRGRANLRDSPLGDLFRATR